MSYIFLLEQGEESSAECFSDIPACALSNGTSTPAKSCLQDSGTDACHASQSGTTCEPSTGNRGKESSMSSAGDSRAKTLAQPEKAQESTGNALDCGAKWPESLAKYDPATSSWRTHQYLLLGGLEEFSETWPRWGMMRSGECWERTTPADLTSVKEYGYLPTPLKSERICWERSSRKTPRKSVLSVLENGHQFRWIYIPLFNQSTPRQAAELSEWMMDWPRGWTDLSAPATDKWQAWQLSHSKCFPLVLANK